MNCKSITPARPVAVVVNDDPIQLKVLSGLLSQAGLEPHGFSKVEAALAAMSAGISGADPSAITRPVLIVTDLHMPGIDGWRFCRLLRSPEYAAFNQTPILVVSATLSGDEPSRIAAEVGAEAFLSAPVDKQGFCEQVQALLKGERMRTALRILIVDDNASLCTLLKEVFAIHGYQADLAFTVQAAAEAFAKNAYDVALLDFHLPDGFGDALLEAFHAQRPDCVCLMMTSDTRPELAVAWMKMGAAAYLHKPFEPAYLLELCARARRERALLRLQDQLELRTRELRESEERFRKLFEQHSAVKLILDPDTGSIIDANEAAANFYGWSIAELRRMRIQQINTLPPESVGSELEKVRASQKVRFEFCHRRADGSLREVEVFCNKIESAGKGMLYSIIHDITERKRVEEALRTAEAKYRTIVENEPECVKLLDCEGRLLEMNPAGLNMIQATSDQVRGKKAVALVADKDQAAFNEMVAAVFRGETRHLEFDMIGLKGRRLTLETTSVPLHDTGPAGGVKALLGVTRDITARKKAEAEREQLETQNQILQKSESLGRMAGAIAHHFNNQLAAVMMNLEFAMQGQLLGEDTKASLAAALQSTRKAAEVSSLMLTYLGQKQGKLEPLDLIEACRRHLPILQATLSSKVILETDFPSPGPNICADGNQIQQVLTNLVTNAREALGEGQGSVRLSVKTFSGADIPANHRFPIDWQPQIQAYACLEVADTGCGIAPLDIEKICDPFFSSKFTGRGLGLSVVLGIVRAHQGVITVESQWGRGSVFRVFLPVTTEPVPPKPIPVVQARKLSGGGTVLLVDDTPTVREAVAKVLKRFGYNVLTAADGVEAVELFRQHPGEIHCVLCDLTMPRMDGWQTLVALRKIAPSIPVILSSGYNESRVMMGDHSERPQAFLGKPYMVEELRDTLARVLDKAE